MSVPVDHDTIVAGPQEHVHTRGRVLAGTQDRGNMGGVWREELCAVTLHDPSPSPTPSPSPSHSSNPSDSSSPSPSPSDSSSPSPSPSDSSSPSRSPSPSLLPSLTSHHVRHCHPLEFIQLFSEGQQSPTLDCRQTELGVRVQTSIQQLVDGGVQKTRQHVTTRLLTNLHVIHVDYSCAT